MAPYDAIHVGAAAAVVPDAVSLLDTLLTNAQWSRRPVSTQMCVLAIMRITGSSPLIQLIEQLKPGGRMVIPVGPQGGSQWLEQYDKKQDGTVEHQRLMGVMYVPLTDKEKQVPSEHSTACTISLKQQHSRTSVLVTFGEKDLLLL